MKNQNSAMVLELRVNSADHRKHALSGTPILLTPSRIIEMLEKRQAFQAAKFRTNCSDCVPNL